jgi:soluble lytic murein transglycosylase-like protein
MRIFVLAAAATGLSMPLSAQEPASSRQVALIDFSSPPISRDIPNEPGLTMGVQSAMTTHFATMDAPAPFPSIVDNWQQSPSPTAFLQVPNWMRTGRSPTAQFALLANSPAIGHCNIRPYQPSNLLQPTAEGRRRMLYPLVQQAACEHGLPIGLMDAMLMQESQYNHMAVSPKGAFGLGQLMPGTAKMLGVNPYDIRSNLKGSARYLRDQYNEFGRYDLALAAYNSGPGRVRKVKRVPYIRETQDYVRIILSKWRHLEQSYTYR